MNRSAPASSAARSNRRAMTSASNRARFSATVPLKSSTVCGTTPSSVTSLARGQLARVPTQRSRPAPAHGRYRPPRSESALLLPAPVRPTSATCSPRWIAMRHAVQDRLARARTRRPRAVEQPQTVADRAPQSVAPLLSPDSLRLSRSAGTASSPNTRSAPASASWTVCHSSPSAASGVNARWSSSTNAVSVPSETSQTASRHARPTQSRPAPAIAARIDTFGRVERRADRRAVDAASVSASVTRRRCDERVLAPERLDRLGAHQRLLKLRALLPDGLAVRPLGLADPDLERRVITSSGGTARAAMPASGGLSATSATEIVTSRARSITTLATPEVNSVWIASMSDVQRAIASPSGVRSNQRDRQRLEVREQAHPQIVERALRRHAGQVARQRPGRLDGALRQPGRRAPAPAARRAPGQQVIVHDASAGPAAARAPGSRSSTTSSRRERQQPTLARRRSVATCRVPGRAGGLTPRRPWPGAVDVLIGGLTSGTSGDGACPIRCWAR